MTETKASGMGFTLTRHGTVSITNQVPAYAWRCQECGWKGLGHTSAAAAISEARRHMETDHGVEASHPSAAATPPEGPVPDSLMNAMWAQFKRMPSSNPGDYAHAAWRWWTEPKAAVRAGAEVSVPDETLHKSDPGKTATPCDGCMEEQMRGALLHQAGKRLRSLVAAHTDEAKEWDHALELLDAAYDESGADGCTCPTVQDGGRVPDYRHGQPPGSFYIAPGCPVHDASLDDEPCNWALHSEHRWGRNLEHFCRGGRLADGATPDDGAQAEFVEEVRDLLAMLPVKSVDIGRYVAEQVDRVRAALQRLAHGTGASA